MPITNGYGINNPCNGQYKTLKNMLMWSITLGASRYIVDNTIYFDINTSQLHQE